MDAIQTIQKLVTIQIALNIFCIVLLVLLASYRTMTMNGYDRRLEVLEAHVTSQNNLLNDTNARAARIEGQLKTALDKRFKSTDPN